MQNNAIASHTAPSALFWNKLKHRVNLHKTKARNQQSMTSLQIFFFWWHRELLHSIRFQTERLNTRPVRDHEKALQSHPSKGSFLLCLKTTRHSHRLLEVNLSSWPVCFGCQHRQIGMAVKLITDEDWGLFFVFFSLLVIVHKHTLTLQNTRG